MKEIKDKEKHVKKTLFVIPAKEQIADRKQIEKMLPYPPNIIFLDKVFKTSDDEYIGEFLVTEQACGGGMHKIGGKYLVFRGVDLPEMAAQLLGVIWGVKHPDFAKDKIVVYRTIKEVSFKKFIFANDLLRIKINSEDVLYRVLGGPEEEKIVIALSGKKFLITAKKEEKATIEQIRLIIGSPELLGLAK
ncbi:hypothetical protein KJ841_00680 [Patescibacteria group bacterium]|nr:hypothetical protein [Patescibacteria group bacterium]